MNYQLKVTVIGLLTILPAWYLTGISSCSDNCDFYGGDYDEDGVCDDYDNCPFTANPDQSDVDGDGIGDSCDECPLDSENDQDGDGFCESNDNCPFVSNPDQTDINGDGIGDACQESMCPTGSYINDWTAEYELYTNMNGEISGHAAADEFCPEFTVEGTSDGTNITFVETNTSNSNEDCADYCIYTLTADSECVTLTGQVECFWDGISTVPEAMTFTLIE